MLFYFAVFPSGPPPHGKKTSNTTNRHSAVDRRVAQSTTHRRCLPISGFPNSQGAVTKGLTDGHCSFLIRDFVLPTGKTTIELKRLIKGELTLAKIDAEVGHIEVGYPSPKDRRRRPPRARAAGWTSARPSVRPRV